MYNILALFQKKKKKKYLIVIFIFFLTYINSQKDVYMNCKNNCIKIMT